MSEAWRVGDVTITKVVETTMVGGRMLDTLIPESSPAILLGIDWLRPHYITEEGSLKLSIHALVVETPSKRILVDTCVGNGKTLPGVPEWDHQQTSFLQTLADMGFEPDSIDVVLCTHLHIDHIGWNTMVVDGKWAPTFKQARYLFSRKEYDGCLAEVEPESGDPPAGKLASYRESILPLIDAGLVDLVESDHRVCDEVSLVATPGHTAGHVSISIASRGERAVITGDSMHHPCLIAHPEWATRVDSDKAQASLTRTRMLNDAMDNDVLMIGTHWMRPTAGKIVREGGGLRLQPRDRA